MTQVPSKSILCDTEIRELCIGVEKPMITPFFNGQITRRNSPSGFTSVSRTPSGLVCDLKDDPEKIISYGLSSFGYDIRCSRKFKIFTNVGASLVDPKNFDPNCFVEYEGDFCIVPPNSFVLTSSMERICVPRDIHVVCMNKSSYARTGLVGNITPLEAGWEGYVTLEFSNTTPLPIKLYAEEGCVQLNFFRGSPCEVSYADRDGKYMHQPDEPVVSRLK